MSWQIYNSDGIPIVSQLGGGAGGASVNFSAGTTSNNLATIVFSNSNGVSFGLNGSTITATVAAGAADGLNRIAAGTQTAGTLATVMFSNSNNVTFGMTNSSIVTASVTVASTQGSINLSAGTTSNLASAFTFANSNGLTFGLNASTITGSHDGLTSQSNQNVTAGNGGFAFQTLSFSNVNGISFGTSAGSAITGSHNALTVQSNQQMTMFATGNTTLSSTGTSNASSLVFRGSGAASVGITNGSILIDVAAGAAAITQSFGISTQTAGGATGGTTGYATGDDILYHFVPGSNITMSQSLNGASATLSIYGPGGGATISSYENEPIFNNSIVTFGVTSLSSAVAFNMPDAGSFSFLRVPVVMTMGSTTIATIASATATAQMGQTSTWNAVVYSVGVGASSKSLMSVASGSGTWNLSAKISISNSTQGSYSLAVSGLADGAGTTLTTQYSVSNTNYSFTSQAFADFSSHRMLDIPFANSLSAGPYWLVIGRSTSSSSAGAALSAITSWGPRYSGHYAGSQAGNFLFGVMGSSNLTSIGVLIGAGVFSTAGGGTTAAFPMSAISSTASHPRMFFQLLRSA